MISRLRRPRSPPAHRPPLWRRSHPARTRTVSRLAVRTLAKLPAPSLKTQQAQREASPKPSQYFWPSKRRRQYSAPAGTAMSRSPIKFGSTCRRDNERGSRTHNYQQTVGNNQQHSGLGRVEFCPRCTFPARFPPVYGSIQNQVRFPSSIFSGKSNRL